MCTSDLEKTETTLALPIPSTDIISFAEKGNPEGNGGAGSGVRIPALYGALKVYGVPQTLVNGFCMAVERAVAKDTSAVGMFASIMNTIRGPILRSFLVHP